jgi:hypothetical protein
MPLSHLLFIPAVFLMGALAGFIGTQHWAPGSLPRSSAATTARPTALATSLAVFIFALLATHFAPIPGGVRALHSSLNHQKLFDQSPTFSIDETYRRIEAFGQSGREAYQLFTFTTDLVFPLALFSFLFALARYVGKRFAPAQVAWSRILMSTVPIAWLLLDLMENGTVYFLLSTHPTQHAATALLLPYLTVSKFSLLAVAFVLPIVVFLSALPRARSIEAIA